MVNLPNYRSNPNNRNIYQNTGMRNTSYRNELYDRTSGYDVPRQLMRNNGNYNQNVNGPRRSNLNLDLNPNRARYATNRVRSFDDTESYHYSNNNGYRYENIYEQIHEEPVYRNINMSSGGAGARHYGRLDVIGHGIGRIERHLSSSCGNIDHYNLGGHYAVLGHSHLGTVGHIRLNAGNAPSNTRETGVKSMNFFSCLGRENSQSMNNIYRASAPTNSGTNSAEAGVATSNPVPEQPSRPTGAIPKSKSKVAPRSSSPPPIHTSNFNRIPKSSLQWLLVNKWLPLWVGQGPDYNVLDFNFMFSRNCEGCGSEPMAQQRALMRFNSNQGEMPHGDCSTTGRGRNGGYIPFEGGSLRPMRGNHSLARLREGERVYIRREGSLDERGRLPRNAHIHERFRPSGEADQIDHARMIFERNLRRRYEMPGPSRAQRQPQPQVNVADPFRHWELNSENNSFRPAHSIRRITDGTFPSPSSRHQDIRIEITDSTGEAVASTSGTGTQPEAKQSGNNELPARNAVVHDAADHDKSSPESAHRRFSENTEDDQSAANRISDNDSEIEKTTQNDEDTDDDEHFSFGSMEESKD